MGCLRVPDAELWVASQFRMCFVLMWVASLCLLWVGCDELCGGDRQATLPSVRVGEAWLQQPAHEAPGCVWVAVDGSPPSAIVLYCSVLSGWRLTADM